MEDIKLGLDINTKSAQSSLKKLANDIAKATSAGNSNIDNLEAKFKKATVAVDEQSKKVEKLKNRLNELESGTGKVTGTAPLEKQLNATNKKIEDTKQKIAELYAYLDQIQANAFKDPKTQEPLLIKSEQKEFDKTIAKIDALEIKLEEAQNKSTQLGTALKDAVGTGTQIEIEKTNLQLKKAQANLDVAKAKATIAGEKLNAETQKGLFNFSGLTNSVEKFGNRILGLAKRVFIFTLFTKAFRALRETIGNVLMADSSFVASLEQLKASLWTAFSPILEFIVPAIKTLVYWLTVAVNSIAKLIAALTGKSFKAMQASGKSLANQAESAKNATSGQKKLKKALKDTNKELKKSIAEFDELNILQDQNADTNADSGNGGAAGGGGAGGAGGGLSGAFGDIEVKITKTMAAIMTAVSGALVALGLILIFTGNIGWGMAAIIAGLTIFSITQEAKITDLDPSMGIDTKLQNIINLAIGLCAAIGIILLFVPNMTLWGVALIAMGIGAFGVSQAFFTDPSGELKLKEKLLVIAQGIGLAVAVIGLILLFFPGKALIGMAMIAAGYRIFNYTSQQLNENGISTKIVEFMKQNVSLIIGVSAVLAIVGIVLMMFKATMLQGFACLTAGVAAFAMSDKATDGALTDKIKTFMEDNVGVIVAVSAVLLIIGIVLCFVATTLMIGIACIVAGVSALKITEASTGNPLEPMINDFISDNLALVLGVSAALVVLGIILCFTPMYLLGIGMLIAGAPILGTAVVINWSVIESNINDFLRDNFALVSGVSIALVIIGILLLCCGVIPLGLGLLAAGAGILGKTIQVNWDFILDKLKEMWRGISDWWGDGQEGQPSYWLTEECWSNLGENISKGIKTGLAGFSTFMDDQIQKLKNFVGLGNKASKNSGSNYTSGGSGGGTRTSALRSTVPNSISVPALASGAVLPPNKPFLSVVGDQSSGTNVETPLSTMIEAFNTALQQNGGYGNQPITIEIDGREFGRAVLKQGNREAKRTTGKLVFE